MNSYKTRASTSFSSTLRPPNSSNSYSVYSSQHQKSRSLTDNHFASSYLYLDLPAVTSSPNQYFVKDHKNARGFNQDIISRSTNDGATGESLSNKTSRSIEYRTVDFLKTVALEKCKGDTVPCMKFSTQNQRVFGKNLKK